MTPPMRSHTATHPVFHALVLAAAVALLSTSAQAADDPAALLAQMHKAVGDATSLRAEFTQEEYDSLFDATEKKQGVILALQREGKPELARISYLKKLVGKRYRDYVHHYWAEDERVVDYNPRARVAKVFARPEAVGGENPANAQEASLLFLKDSARLNALYKVGLDAASQKEGENAVALAFEPREKGKTKLKKIVLWIDRATHLPVRCQASKDSGEVDTLHIDKLELNANLTPSDIVIDLPGDVMVVNEK